MTWYGFGRMLIEGLRTDSLYVGPVRISQLVGFVCFVAGAAVIAWRRVIIHKNAKTAVLSARDATEEKENENGENN